VVRGQDPLIEGGLEIVNQPTQNVDNVDNDDTTAAQRSSMGANRTRRLEDQQVQTFAHSYNTF